ncbi:hypothetical protein ABH909_001975 [Pseudomonas sp. BS3782 TE3695]|jgi:hypothetical protein
MSLHPIIGDKLHSFWSPRDLETLYQWPAFKARHKADLEAIKQ